MEQDHGRRPLLIHDGKAGGWRRLASRNPAFSRFLPSPDGQTAMRHTRLPLALMTALLAIHPTAPALANATRPAPVFAPCASCHSIEPGKTVFGPNLSGIANRKAASLPGYAYSPALKASRLTWNAATLDRWLRDPKKLVPGTKMPFGGISDAKTRKAVVDYLMTVK